MSFKVISELQNDFVPIMNLSLKFKNPFWTVVKRFVHIRVIEKFFAIVVWFILFVEKGLAMLKQSLSCSTFHTTLKPLSKLFRCDWEKV